MPGIKTRESVKQAVKTLNRSAVLAEKTKKSLLQTKEKAEQGLYGKENSTEEYAADKLESGVRTAVSRTVYRLDKTGRWGVKESRQNVSKALEKFKKSQEEKLVKKARAKPETAAQPPVPEPVQKAGKSAGQTAKEGMRAAEDSAKAGIRAAQKSVQSSAKTVHQAVKSTGKAVKTGAKSARKTIKTAEHTVKTAQKSVKTAEQAGKTAVKTAQATVKTIKAAIPADKAAEKARVRGTKAATKATVAPVKGAAAGVKALAAAIAAGGWIAVVVIVVLCCIGGVFGLLLNGGEPVVPDTSWKGTGIFEWPLPQDFTITSPFGYREDPFTGELSYHNGVDIAAPEATPILAAADGTVTIANDSDSWGDSYGYHVIIWHDSTYETLYAHCSAVFVQPGQEVEQGEVIALVGSTGNSTGNHLHFEVREDGTEVDGMAFFEKVN